MSKPQGETPHTHWEANIQKTESDKCWQGRGEIGPCALLVGRNGSAMGTILRVLTGLNSSQVTQHSHFCVVSSVVSRPEWPSPRVCDVAAPGREAGSRSILLAPQPQNLQLLPQQPPVHRCPERRLHRGGTPRQDGCV